MRNATQRVYPVISLIVILNNGNVTDFVLEDMTEACSGNATVEPIIDIWFNQTQNNLAGCPLPYCNASNNADGICDPKIFVSWMGTDNGGNNLISSSQRFMNFKNYNLAGMWQSILGVSSRANSTDVLMLEPNQLNGTVATRLANPPAYNLTTLNGTSSQAPPTTNTTSTTNTTTNSTDTTNGTNTTTQ